MKPRDITNLIYWENITPSVYIYPYNTSICFVLIVLDMYIDKTFKSVEESHPFGFADLYVATVFTSPRNKTKLHFQTDLVTEDKTITFCMELAKSISMEWERDRLF